jgi:hypothetical protein
MNGRASEIEVALLPGDYLTSASIPGFAMKATQAGRVLGQVMEDLTEEKMYACPSSGLGMLPRTRCGEVMVFVNLTNYLGAKVETAMLDYYQNKLDALTVSTETSDSLQNPSQISLDDLPIDINPPGSELRQAQILSYLSELRNNQNPDESPLTEVFAQRINAISEIISPQVIANLVKANALSVNSVTTQELTAATGTIESLLVSSVSGGDNLNVNINLGLGGALQIMSDALSDASTTPELPQIAASIDSFGNAYFAGNVESQNIKDIYDQQVQIQDDLLAFSEKIDYLSNVLILDEDGNLHLSAGLTVSGQTLLQGGLVVDEIGQDEGLLNILGDVVYFGRPYFTSDTAGFALIKQGQDKVDITFDREYLEQPVVNANISSNRSTTTPDFTLDLAKVLFENDIRYLVVDKDEKGFSIILNKPAPKNITFSWIALAVNGSKTFTSLEPAQIPPITELNPAPEVLGTTTPQNQNPTELQASTSQESAAEPQPTPTPIVEQTQVEANILPAPLEASSSESTSPVSLPPDNSTEPTPN